MTNNIENYDFTIVGGGLIGSIVAMALSEQKYKCCLIEKEKLDYDNKKQSTVNPISINYRSILILKKYKLWDPSKIFCNNINDLIFKCHNNLHKLSFSSKHLKIPTLGYVLDRSSFTNYIQTQCKQLEKIKCYNSTKIKDMKINSDDRFEVNLITNNNEKKILSTFVIASDGSPSEIATKIGFDMEHINYNQTSHMFNCVADFTNNLAIQHINNDGFFAHIPFSDKGTNIILTINDDRKKKYFDTDNRLKSEIIYRIFQPYLKNILSLKYITSYKMHTIRSKEIFLKNFILLGNSSQLLHPVGAQGFNLGLRNIETLTDNLSLIKKKDDTSIKNALENVAEIISKDRQKTFDYIDFSTKIISNNRTFSILTSSLLIHILKCSKTAKTSFLNKILGLDGIKYLALKNEF